MCLWLVAIILWSPDLAQVPPLVYTGYFLFFLSVNQILKQSLLCFRTHQKHLEIRKMTKYSTYKYIYIA